MNVQTTNTREATRPSAQTRLQPVGDGIWTVHHPRFTAGGLQLGTRTTVVRLSDGSLWVHSPGPLDDSLQRQLREEGRVSHLVAPNNLHHLFLGDYVAAFPEARVVASPGALKKIRAPAAVALSETPLADWEGVLDQRHIEGIPLIDETAFFHGPSATLILADLCFNVQTSSSWFTRTAMRFNGGWQRFGATRLMRSAIKDRGAVRQSVDRLLEWPTERVSVCHGERIERGGQQVLRAAFDFLREG